MNEHSEGGASIQVVRPKGELFHERFELLLARENEKEREEVGGGRKGGEREFAKNGREKEIERDRERETENRDFLINCQMRPNNK